MTWSSSCVSNRNSTTAASDQPPNKAIILTRQSKETTLSFSGSLLSSPCVLLCPLLSVTLSPNLYFPDYLCLTLWFSASLYVPLVAICLSIFSSTFVCLIFLVNVSVGVYWLCFYLSVFLSFICLAHCLSS